MNKIRPQRAMRFRSQLHRGIIDLTIGNEGRQNDGYIKWSNTYFFRCTEGFI